MIIALLVRGSPVTFLRVQTKSCQTLNFPSVRRSIFSLPGPLRGTVVNMLLPASPCSSLAPPSVTNYIFENIDPNFQPKLNRYPSSIAPPWNPGMSPRWGHHQCVWWHSLNLLQGCLTADFLQLRQRHTINIDHNPPFKPTPTSDTAPSPNIWGSPFKAHMYIQQHLFRPSVHCSALVSKDCWRSNRLLKVSWTKLFLLPPVIILT